MIDVATQYRRSLISAVATLVALAGPCSLRAATDSADTVFTALSLRAAVDGGAALHASSFSQLPGFPTCCTTFDGATGLALGFAAGIEVDPRTQFLGMSLRYGADLAMTSMGATLSTREFVGNIIRDQERFDGVVEHTIDATYVPVGVEPFVAVRLPDVDPLSLRLGLSASIPVLRSFVQKQTLMEPTDQSYTFETGSRTRAEVEAVIPDAGIRLALTLGAAYDVPVNDQFTLAPYVRFDYPLTAVSSGVTWSVNTLRVGAELRMRMRKAMPPPPPPPPVIVEERRPTVDVSILAGTTGILTGDTVDLPVMSERTTILSYMAAPVVFFAHNSTELLTTPGTRPQEQVLEALAALLQRDPTARITVIASAAADEDPSIIKQRVGMVLSRLGGSQDQYTIRMSQAGPAKYQQINDEFRSIRFEINGSSTVIPASTVTTERTAEDLPIHVLPTTACDGGPCSVTINGRITGVFGGTPMSVGEVMTARDAARINLSGNVLPSFASLALTFDVAVRTPQGRRDTTVRIEGVIRPTVLRSDTSRTVVDRAGNASSDVYTVGYFGYDAATFTAVDAGVAALARRAKAEGKRITIIAETDELGSAEYNQQLRRQRAAAALQLLGLAPADVTLDVDQQPASPAASPMERVARRKVSIRITDR